jgi:hypothetical protein
MIKLYGHLLLVILFVGCKCRSAQIVSPANDTTKALQLALRTALLEYKLPEISPLFRGNLFEDSILVDIDSFPKRLLPAALDTIKFKFGSYRQITDLIGKITDSSRPNYLFVCCFQKMDSVYSVSVQSRSDVRFGGGGAMDVEIIKRGDSFVVKHAWGNSIN